MRNWLLAAGLAVTLTACAGTVVPKTPQQALVEAYGGFGTAVTAFNLYASQRPFCGDVNAKAPPLCADRDIVIQGDAMASKVADGLEIANQTLKAVNASDAQWSALADPIKLVSEFQSFVVKVRGQ